MLSHNTLTINDNHYPASVPRKKEFINIHSARQLEDTRAIYAFADDVVPKHLIKMHAIMVGKSGRAYDRQVTAYMTEAAVIGGLCYSVFYVFQVIFMIFGKPFKELELAVSF
jgi:hypothetical protein